MQQQLARAVSCHPWTWYPNVTCKMTLSGNIAVKLCTSSQLRQDESCAALLRASQMLIGPARGLFQ
jgi:hypothetical protein